MKTLMNMSLVFVLLLLTGCNTTKSEESAQDAIGYRVLDVHEGHFVVIETVEIAAPVGAVWDAFTTSDGYASWAAPAARVDLRPGGSIVSSYDTELGLDSPHVNSVRIVNYVPERLLTLQADVSQNWPDVLKRDAENLYNVILFEPFGEGRTRITSYGLGYTDSPELRKLMSFFESANRGLYEGLIESLE